MGKETGYFFTYLEVIKVDHGGVEATRWEKVKNKFLLRELGRVRSVKGVPISLFREFSAHKTKWTKELDIEPQLLIFIPFVLKHVMFENGERWKTNSYICRASQ